MARRGSRGETSEECATMAGRGNQSRVCSNTPTQNIMCVFLISLQASASHHGVTLILRVTRQYFPTCLVEFIYIFVTGASPGESPLAHVCISPYLIVCSREPRRGARGRFRFDMSGERRVSLCVMERVDNSMQS